jgi:hypothetical protein
MVFLHHKAMDRLGGVFAILYRLHGQILSGFYAVPPSEKRPQPWSHSFD